MVGNGSWPPCVCLIALQRSVYERCGHTRAAPIGANRFAGEVEVYQGEAGEDAIGNRCRSRCLCGDLSEILYGLSSGLANTPKTPLSAQKRTQLRCGLYSVN
jgi:hypothetical protein